jgi:CheY-like chemotaxis protein
MRPAVLICDNEEILRALIRATLESEPYELLEARDGDEALRVARQAQPDVVVLDMMMPGRSGLDVLAELRADDDLASTPVLMLTARARSSDREAALAAGADVFLPKPFSPAALMAAVEELVAARK